MINVFGSSFDVNGTGLKIRTTPTTEIDSVMLSGVEALTNDFWLLINTKTPFDSTQGDNRTTITTEKTEDNRN